jgi:hypothetical protein
MRRAVQAPNGAACAFDEEVRLRLVLVVAGLLCAGSQARAAEAPSRCVECHRAVAGPPERVAHVAEWRSSAHAACDISSDAGLDVARRATDSSIHELER